MDKCEWKNGEFVGCCEHINESRINYGQILVPTKQLDTCPFCGADIRKPKEKPIEAKINIGGIVATAAAKLFRDTTKEAMEFEERLNKMNSLSPAMADLCSQYSSCPKADSDICHIECNVYKLNEQGQSVCFMNDPIKKYPPPSHQEIMKPERFWRGCDKEEYMTWEKAALYCEERGYYIHDDWRDREYFSGRTFSDGTPREK